MFHCAHAGVKWNFWRGTVKHSPMLTAAYLQSVL